MDIVITPNNVLNEGEEVRVTEEVFDEKSSLYLNFEQISTEITNLLLTRYKKDALRRKSGLFVQMFFGQKEALSKQHTIMPVVKITKILSYDPYKPENHYSPDPEYDAAHFGHGEALKDFLSRYAALNMDTTMPYPNASKALYNLQRGFLFSPKTLVTENTDAFRHSVFDQGTCMQYNKANYSYEIVRLIKKASLFLETGEEVLYEGDNLDVVGYYNVIEGKDRSVHRVFDLQQYVQAVNGLKENDPVVLWFNDFVFYNRKPIESVAATVASVDTNNIELLLSKPVVYRGTETKTMYYYPRRSNNMFFVYHQNNRDVYHKGMLANTNIAFKMYKSPQKTLRYIAPNNTSEVLYIHREKLDNVFNMQELEEAIHNTAYYLQPYDLSVVFPKRLPNPLPPTKPSYHVPSYVDTVPLLRNIEGYMHARTHFDSSLNRMLHMCANTSYGFLHMARVSKHALANLHKRLSTSRDMFVSEIEKNNYVFKDQKKQPIPYTQPAVCKTYASIKNLEDDNGKDIYFDKQFDKTMYRLKEGARPTMSDKEMKAFLSKKLAEAGAADIDFEAESIIAGMRKVRPGDFAILYVDNAGECVTTPVRQIRYVRQVVAKKPMWIKAVASPFPVCENKLDEYIETKPVLDPFDQACRNSKVVKDRIKYQNAVDIARHLESIVGFIDNYETYSQQIDYDIEQYSFLPGSYQETRHISSSIVETHLEETNYEDFLGTDEPDIDKLYGETFEFGEARAVMGRRAPAKEEVPPNSDILETISQMSDIPLEDIHKAYILGHVNMQVPSKNIEERIEAERTKLDKQRQVLEKKHGVLPEAQRKKLDEIASKKIKEAEVSATRDYYKEVIIQTASMLSLLIMAQYPMLLLRQVYPKCLQFFSYAGHPISSDVQKSLTKYFACLVVSAGTPGDIKFGSFTSIEEVEREMKKCIDEILLARYDLKTQVTLNKNEINKKQVVVRDDSRYAELNVFYKPSQRYPSSTPNKVISFLKKLNSIVKTNPVLKINIFNNPTIVNSCCMEMLTKNTTYYDFFASDTELKKLLEGVSKERVSLKRTHSYIPKNKTTLPADVFVEKTISFPHGTSSFVEKKEPVERKWEDVYDLLKLDKNNEWWEGEFYEDLVATYTQVFEIMKSTLDDFDISTINFLKGAMIDITSYNNIHNTRSYLASFINNKFKTLLGKIVNLQRFRDPSIVEPGMMKILNSVYTFEAYHPILKAIKNMLRDIKTVPAIMYGDEAQLKRSILLMSSQLFGFFKEMLYIPGDVYDTKNALITKQSCEVVMHVLVVLSSYITTNDSNSAKIKLAMETLRERNKQKLIEAYSKDEEHRQLQIELRKMGDKNILKTEDDDTRPPKEDMDKDMSKIRYEAEVMENLDYAGFKGENDEADEAEGEYVVDRKDY